MQIITSLLDAKKWNKQTKKANKYLYCYPAGVDSVLSKWPETCKRCQLLN